MIPGGMGFAEGDVRDAKSAVNCCAESGNPNRKTKRESAEKPRSPANRCITHQSTTAGAAGKSCRQLLKYVPFRKSCQCAEPCAFKAGEPQPWLNALHSWVMVLSGIFMDTLAPPVYGN